MKRKYFSFAILFALVSMTLVSCDQSNNGAAINAAAAGPGGEKTPPNEITSTTPNNVPTGEGTQVSGTISNAANLTLFLDQMQFDNSNEVIGKAQFDANGQFSLALDEIVQKGIYRLRIGARRAYIALGGNEKQVKLNGDLETFHTYGFTVEGSPAASFFVKSMIAVNKDPENAMTLMSQSGADPLSVAFITYSKFKDNSKKIDYLQSLKSKLNQAMPGNKYATDFTLLIDAQVGRLAALRANELVQVGKPAPEINLPDPMGKTRSLKDYKGKIVLLDFWASWCGPCRKANPHVVETYKKYKDQGFTVFSVSLDGINPRMMNRYKTEDQVNQQLEKAKSRWEQAIQKDNLIWDGHVSDLQHWNSVAAKTYGVRSIPQTFLIDRDGNIAAINPRMDLEAQLKRLL